MLLVLHVFSCLFTNLFSFANCRVAATGRLKMQEWKMRYGQKCKGGNVGAENAGADHGLENAEVYS